MAGSTIAKHAGIEIALPYHRSRGEAATTAALDAETRLIAFLKGGAS